MSFVSPRRVPQWADAEAVVAGITLQAGVHYTGLCLNEHRLTRAIATGRLKIEGSINLCASPAFLARNQNSTPEKRRETRRAMIAMFRANGVPVTSGGISAALGCNFQGEITTAQLMATIAEVFDLANESGVVLDNIGLSDTMGWATLGQITRTMGTIREAYPDQSLTLHLHDTRGMAIANAYAGLMMGVADFDTSIGGIGGCPFAAHKGAAGNLCTEDFAFMCEEWALPPALILMR
ncbi:MAG: 4-hydroxy 2-oxovalerate aldolase [Cypionkella sp.]|nr:4-hydroxy 2-oxovalerate aldolase [Cypionkella sp.]